MEAIINQLDKDIFQFIDQLTDRWKKEHDVQMFYLFLNGFHNGRDIVTFKLRIGSNRRLNMLPYEVFFNEFTVQMEVSAHVFDLKAVLFFNTLNKYEEFRYSIHPHQNNGLPERNWIFPREADTSESNQFFKEILNLLSQDRDIRIYSEVSPAIVKTKSRKREILEAIFSAETLKQYKQVKITKFARYELTPVEILRWIPEKIQQAAEAEPDTKIFFEEDVYFTALSEKNISGTFNYGIGVDPDKNKYFNFQEE